MKRPALKTKYKGIPPSATNVRTLADAFAAEVRAPLGADLAVAIERNRSEERTDCAITDFCRPKQLMDAAWSQAFGRMFVNAPSYGERKLRAEAWETARRNDYWIGRG